MLSRRFEYLLRNLPRSHNTLADSTTVSHLQKVNGLAVSYIIYPPLQGNRFILMIRQVSYIGHTHNNISAINSRLYFTPRTTFPYSINRKSTRLNSSHVAN